MEVESQMRPASISSVGVGADGGFTEADLAAADQLVQLSASGGGDEAASPTSSTLSARSVNNAEAAASAAAREEDGRHVDGGVLAAPWLDRRARKRYRLVAELYDATGPVNCGGGGTGGERRREDREMGKR